MTRPRAVIVGAGIAGLSAAWWLDQAGWDSIIVERATSLRENGYIITLSGACLATLERMGLREKLNSAAYAFNQNAFRDNKGRELLRVSYSEIMRDIPFLNLRRSELVRVLADALPDSTSILFGQTVDEITDHGEMVEVKLSSGDTITADLLVGADGFRSQVRQYIANPEESLEPLGYRMAVYDIESHIKLEPDCVSYTTPGHLDIFYCLPGQRLVALNIWRDDNPEPETRKDRFSLLKEVCKGSHSLVQDVVKRAEEEGTSLVTDSLTMVNPPRWSKGRIVLVGDSAFCLTFFSGQGAGMTLVASEVLGKAIKAAPDLSTALADYEKQMRPAITRLQTRVRSLAAAYLPKGTVAFHTRNMLLRLTPRWVVAYYHRKGINEEIMVTR
ncbi:hypothetical protein BJY00DRAFT_306679 [Aspergillus carlsbadensis]|nr:hypothetical protein BJY00DRAFT_306679 [Aspergillus carlsbadensis]